MITVSGKTLGLKKPLFADWSIPFPPDVGDGGLTLRDLISRIVRAEVEAFRTRQEERRTFRALTARDISAAAERGKIDMGGSDLKQEVDAEQAVGVALEAFGDGLFLVVVDGEDVRDLDAPVRLQPDSRVTFIRLAMLAGG
jgi:hypothetical protein